MDKALNDAIQQLAGDLGRMLVERNRVLYQLTDAVEQLNKSNEKNVELVKEIESLKEKIHELEFRVDAMKNG